MSRKHTITAALTYANGPLHIGHMAGVFIPADTYARFLRAIGKEVAFISGSDEHGVAITMKARKENTTPQAIVDRYHKEIQESLEQFGISLDYYGRTSSQTHTEMAQSFFSDIESKGLFEVRESEQYFDEQEGLFLADRYIQGECPNCGKPEAYGDQCEGCGSTLSPLELVNPKSTVSGNAPIKKKTTHWYLPLQEFQPWLEQYILEDKKGKWKSNVYGQCSSWLKEGLQPRAVTRDLDWGIPVPNQKGEGKVLYVWFDAPIGYISATAEWAKLHGKRWEDYWKSENTEITHFIGKDNIVFHCIIFPSILKAKGDFQMPTHIPAFEFLNLEGQKISTSKNWAVWLHEYLKDFPERQDLLRYMLTSVGPETKDNDFTWKDFQTKNNSELVGVLGNFAHRVFTLLHKYYNGAIPESREYSPEASQIISQTKELRSQIENSLHAFRFREAQQLFMGLARLGNKYLTESEPWKHAKSDPEATAEILHVCAQIIGKVSILARIFLPQTEVSLLDILHTSAFPWEALEQDILLESGHKTKQPYLLFERIEDETIDAQALKLEKMKEKAEKEQTQWSPQKTEGSFEQFAALDFRVGTILTAEKVKKSKKLLLFQVDIGFETRQIVSGVAEHFSPEECIGKRVMALINLAPKTIRGVQSNGMLLLSESEQGTLQFIQPQPESRNGDTIA